MTFQHALQVRHSLQESVARKPQEIKSELRVLKIQFPNLVIGYCQQVAAFDAFDGLGSALLGRQQSKLAENLTGLERFVQLRDPVCAFDYQEHFICKIILAEKQLALPTLSLGHEGLEPVHGQIPAGCNAHLFDKLEHLIKSKRVQRHQDDVQKNRCDRMREEPEKEEENRACNACDAQRYHGLH